MTQRSVLIVGAVGLVMALATAGTALAFAAPAGSSGTGGTGCAGTSPKLTVQGTGMTTATPDVLTVSVGIDVTDSTAQVSLDDDNSRASAVTAALKQGGVLNKDVQTSNLSIEPSYNDKGVINGYEVTNTLTAQLRDFSNAGSIIDSLAAAAGNSVRINSLSFSLADPRVIEDEARSQAVHQAVSHAHSMAQAAEERLGPVCSLSDDTPIVPSPLQYNDIAGPAASASQVPLEPGSQQASAQVTMVYALEPVNPLSR